MDRRKFVARSSLAAGALLVPGALGGRGDLGALARVPTEDRKALADAALAAAREAGASYADVRIGRYLTQTVSGRERAVQTVSGGESFGAGVRVLVAGTWGFAATPDVTTDALVRAAREAAAVARANARLQVEPVQLAPNRGWGEVKWRTPVRKNPFAVPVKEKAEFLVGVGDAALRAGASFVTYGVSSVNEQKYFASTDGSYIDQDFVRINPSFSVTVVDRQCGFAERNSLCEPVGMGWEYLDGTPADGIVTPAGAVVYGERYDMLADVRRAAAEAREKVRARGVEPGQWTLVLDPSHLWLTIHESVGHPLELDRVLGYEANYAGTSFATLDKWKSGSFRYGSPLVNFVADRTQKGSLAAAGWDDDGVKCREWDPVKDGILVNYQVTRDQAHILGLAESQGCAFAQRWDEVSFQRMPNVSLRPDTGSLTPAQLISQVDRGIYIMGRGSYSIDQQRYNFQFGGQLFYEIKGGKVVGMLKDVAYQSNTQQFWNNVTALCGRQDYRLGGSFYDGKGQPSQVNAVSHGCPTTRFDDVTVLNTGKGGACGAAT
ncbi:MAG TPA: TldD/PmbA family protein [Gemmatimonadales bacterium]|nr:TldD/PmbA family protein [Gemmatimonadales bacterium]